MSTDVNLSSSKIQMNLDDRSGFHMRPMAKLVEIASQFKSEIVIEYNNTRANGKSILDIMMLGITTSTEFTVYAHGDDADNALQAIRDFFKSFTGD